MLIIPRPLFDLLCLVSNPHPLSDTRNWIESSVFVSRTFIWVAPLCLTAFCKLSCATRKTHKDMSSGIEADIPSSTNSMLNPRLLETSEQKLLRAEARPKCSSFEGCSLYDML